MLFRQGPSGLVISTAPVAKPGEGIVKTADMEVQMSIRVLEWRQMFNEIWRGERDFFYDPERTD